MDRILVRPSGPLSGDVKINGAKNSALKLMAACTLAQGTYLLNDVPDITDVQSMTELLRSMGLTVNTLQKNQIQITNSGDITPEAPYEQVEKMRASIVVLGPLVATYGKARVAHRAG